MAQLARWAGMAQTLTHGKANMEHSKFARVEQDFRAFVSGLEDLDVNVDQVHIERYDRHVPGLRRVRKTPNPAPQEDKLKGRRVSWASGLIKSAKPESPHKDN